MGNASKVSVLCFDANKKMFDVAKRLWALRVTFLRVTLHE